MGWRLAAALLGILGVALLVNRRLITSPSVATVTSTFLVGEQHMQNGISNSSIAAQFIGRRAARPPLGYLLFDVTLNNTDSQSMWYLLPQQINETPLAKGGVDGVEVFKLPGMGRVLLARFQGNGGFQAVYIPAGGRVVIHGLAFLDRRSGDAQPPTLPTLLTPSLKVGAEDVRDWLKDDPLSSQQADVRDEQSELILAHHTADRSEVTCSAPQAQLRSINLSMIAPNQSP